MCFILLELHSAGLTHFWSDFYLRLLPLTLSVASFDRDSGVVDQLPVHHRAHSQRQQQAVSLSPTSLAARGEYGEDHMSDKFTEGQDVLARWSDGLFYLGTITKVSVSLGH